MRLKPVLFLLLLASCLATQAQNPASPPPDAKKSALDAPLFYQLLLGEISAKNEEPATAFSLLLNAARSTNDPLIFRRAVQIALQAHSGESALQAAKAWSQNLPKSREANRFVLQILISLNRLAETLEPLKNEFKLTPAKELSDAIWSIPSLYERVKDRQLVTSIVQKALIMPKAKPTIRATILATLGRLQLASNDQTAALRAAVNGQAIDVNSEHIALLALALLRPDTPQAERLVKKHLPSARPEFHLVYVKTLLSAQRLDDAKLALRDIRFKYPGYADAWLVDGALALQAGQDTLAERHLLHYLDLLAMPTSQEPAPQTRRGRSQAFFSLAQIAQHRQDLEQAEGWLQRVDYPDDVVQAQIRRATLIGQQGRVDEAIGLIHAQVARSEADAQLKRTAEVQVLREQKLYLRAIESLKSFMQQRPDDLDMVYDLAMVYEKTNDLPEMEKLLRRLMLAKPNDPHAFNALGYSLADRNVRLPEALQLISKALELSPKDPLIVDSLAWAEFRSGQFERALALLQQAFKDKPDPEIAAHLGEVLWVMQRQPEAIQVFKTGLQLKADNEALNETIQRLQVPL